MGGWFRPLLRDLVGDTLAMAGLTDPARRARDHLTIATFHRVLPDSLRRSYPLPGLAVTPEQFDWFLRYFLGHYTCGTLFETWERWVGGDRPTKPFLAVTFDDGQGDNFEYARPLLERLGVRATFFVTVDFVGSSKLLWHDRLAFAVQGALTKGETTRRQLLRLLEVENPAAPSSAAKLTRLAVMRAKRLAPAARDDHLRCVDQLAGLDAPDWARMMTWEQVRRLAEVHEIGSHTMTHPLLPQCTDAEIEGEVGNSRHVLQERLGTDAIPAFCYPNGDHDQRTIAAVRAAGYRVAVSTSWGSNPRAASPLALGRCDMHPDHAKRRDGSMSTARLAWRLSGWYPGLR